jgi:hypothetical protein
MRHTGLRCGLSTLAALGYAVITSATAQPLVSGERMRATGQRFVEIEKATDDAYRALDAKIKERFGPQWGLGSRRGAEYTCRKAMSGGPVARLGWTCTLTAVPYRLAAG